MEHFKCSCCGTGFQSTTEEQRQYDRDTGYGLCGRCAAGQRADEEKALQKSIDLVRGALNEKNRAHFDGLTLDEKKVVALAAIDEGIITWSVAGHKGEGL